MSYGGFAPRKALAARAARTSAPFGFGFGQQEQLINEQNLDTPTLNRLALVARDETIKLESKFLELIEHLV